MTLQVGSGSDNQREFVPLPPPPDPWWYHLNSGSTEIFEITKLISSSLKTF